jgi:two-component system sensor histidine kinase SenX3
VEAAIAVLAGGAGVVIGALVVWLLLRGGGSLAVRGGGAAPAAEAPPLRDVLPAGVADVLAVLRSSAIVVDAADAVINSSPAAIAYGLVRDGELVHAELRDLARRVRRDGVIREAELALARGPMGHGHVVMQARVASLPGSHVLLLLEDHTQARRVEEIRRDFVANVSHELKTPVGGLSLLAEAVQDAKDDPEAVSRFAQRMQTEAARLGQLVKEIVDLSRLQGADALHEPQLVDVCAAVREAKGIDIVESCQGGLTVFGDEGLVVTAVRNLVGNAIAYSEPRTRVAVGTRLAGAVVEITVSDQGRGIPEPEQQRIFERFYRVDEARSRATGGTGLGLAIVKHICANHGGDVTVWSEEGRGSTFTIRLPAAGLGRAPATLAATPPRREARA